MITGFFLCLINSVFAQKKSLDFSVQDNWPVLVPKLISNDGKYVVYTISTIKNGVNLTVQSTERAWKRTISSLENATFTQDSKRLIFSRSDSIGILDLQKDSLYYITDANHLAMPKNGKGQWLAYQLKQTAKELALHDFFTGLDVHYPGVTDFLFSDDGKTLVIQVDNGNKKEHSKQVIWLNLASGKKTIIAENCQVANMTFDHVGRQFIFLAKEERDNKSYITLRYFKPGMSTSTILADPASQGMDSMIVTGIPIFFSPNDSRVFFRIQHNATDTMSAVVGTGSVHVQNYQDDENYHSTIIDSSKPRLATIALVGSPKVILLEKIGDSYNISPEDFGDDFIIKKNSGVATTGRDSSKVSKVYYSEIYLVSCRDGSRKAIARNIVATQQTTVFFSPGKKYFCWFDRSQKNWMAYSIMNGKTRNITAATQVSMCSTKDYPNDGPNTSAGLIGWLDKDERMIVQDEFSDIWMIDPEGVKSPSNLTLGYCRDHYVQFQYVDFKKDWNHSIPFLKTDTLLLSALDRKTKMNGFFQVVLEERQGLVKLVMEPSMFYHNGTYAGTDGGIPPVTGRPLKAKFSNIYIVTRMSATEYPNLFLSNNLKDFRPLTDLNPQKNYNWFTSELHQWKLPDGKETQGVLYKPQDLNLNKKYPVIFFFYEKHSSSLNCFVNSALSRGSINIPWYTSNGYLVFVPDIYYHTGHPGQSAYDAVASATDYLSKFSYVDSKHLGLQGHSFGGYETNYIVSKTNLFAAAAPAAAVSDLISGYAASTRDQRYYEDGQGRIGATFWQRPDLYFENSPIFRANQVTTPLMILHNPNDDAVPFSQAKEWYYGLARAGKQVWMVSYDDEGHTINNEKNKLDYTIRQTQFFDHFLKGKPAPDWMTSKPDYSILKSSGK